MAPMTSTHPLNTSNRVIRLAGALAGSASTIDDTTDTCGAESHKQEPAALLLGIAPGEPHSPPFVGGPSAPAEGLPISTSDGDSARAVVMRGIWRADRWVRTTHQSKAQDGRTNGRARPLPIPRVRVASAAFTWEPVPARRHVALSCVSLPGASAGSQVERFFTNRTSSQELPIERAKSGTTNVDRGVALRIGRGVASQRITSIGLPQTASTDVAAGRVRSEAAVSMPPTIANSRDCEFSQEGDCSRMTNTARQTSKHMDTMDELRESIRQFVRSGKVVSIEEGRMLRLAEAAYDEAQLLDYAFALLGCGLKENGVFGQRFNQLMREADAYRIGMAERDAERAMETAQSVSADQAA